jgi:hypothetical protein
MKSFNADLANVCWKCGKPPKVVENILRGFKWYDIVCKYKHCKNQKTITGPVFEVVLKCWNEFNDTKKGEL